MADRYRRSLEQAQLVLQLSSGQTQKNGGRKSARVRSAETEDTFVERHMPRVDFDQHVGH